MDNIREAAEKYFEEELSGEPLYQDLVIDWLTEFAESQLNLHNMTPKVQKLLFIARPAWDYLIEETKKWINLGWTVHQITHTTDGVWLLLYKY
jgi:hypothetical protein